MSWAAVMTHPRREAYAQENVDRQAGRYRSWLPRVSPTEVLFPNYLLVEPLGGGTASLGGTRGVVGVIGFLRQVEVERLRSLVGEDGYFKLPPRFAEGEAVSISRGLYSGALAIYDGMVGYKRSAVLLSMLGASVRHELDDSALTAA